MKKLLAASTLVLLLTACGSFQDDLSKEVHENPPVETLQGTLNKSSLGFFIETESGSRIKVESLEYNLKKYLGRSLEITGQRPSAGSALAIQDLLVLGSKDGVWSVYKNDRLGFSVSYRSLWDIKEESDAVHLTPYPADLGELVDRISITQLQNQQQVDLKAWLSINAEYASNSTDDTNTYGPSVVGPDQLSAIKKMSAGGGRVDFYVSRTGLIYKLSYASVDNEESDNYRNIFFDMLNSFRFIPIDGSFVFEDNADDSTPLEQEPAVTESEPDAAVSKPASETEDVQPEPEPEPESAIEPAPETESEPAEEAEQQNPNDLLDGFTSLSSRGFHIDLQYPKNWYWQQFGSKIAFAGGDMEGVEDGLVFLERSSDLNVKAGLLGECKEVEGSNFCLYGDPDDDENAEKIKEMLSYASTILGTIVKNDL